jgi:hypothetical protein
VQGAEISKCSFEGTTGVRFFADTFATGTSEIVGFTPTLNSNPFTYDGNYDFSSLEGGGLYTRYLEWRPYPAMLDGVISNCFFAVTGRSIAGTPASYENNFYFTGTLDGGGKLKTFNTVRQISNTFTANRLWLPANTYMDETYPNSIQNCTFSNNTHNASNVQIDIDLSLALHTCKIDGLSVVSQRAAFFNAPYVYNTEFESLSFTEKSASAVLGNISIDRAINVTFRDSQLWGGSAVLRAVNGVTTNDAFGPINFDNCTFIFDTTVPSNRVVTINGGSNIDSVWVGVPVIMKNCNLVSLA